MKIFSLFELPAELFDAVIAQLVTTIGIRRAVLLRPVCRSFNAALLHAICDAQVVDSKHPLTLNLSIKSILGSEAGSGQERR
jgi:hypothetical protein